MNRTLCLILLLLLAWLPGCSATSPLLGQVALSADVLRPTNQETITISYLIGRQARVSVFLVAADGQTTYTLRENEPRERSSDAYVLRFDGTAPTGDPNLLRRLLPAGTYRVVVSATDSNGEKAEASQALTIEGSDIPLPEIADLVAMPTTISPNADGIDDVAEITYRLPITATIDILVTSPSGERFALVASEEQEPILHRQIWNGRTPDGRVLPDGLYTYTIQARDIYGSVIQRQEQITLVGSGQPEVTITYSYMAPQAIMLSNVFTVTMRVKNTGTVPIRTYGPASGYEYSTQQVFSSIEEGQYAAKSGGFWRIGVDWDANSGAGKRYPFRWAISPRPPEQWKVPFVEDLLMPGEEALVIGRIKVDQQETRMGFYVGLIQDGVGFFQDKTGRTIIRVGF
ncbi:MAG: hypothetical protein Fur005_04570 [Roseiflexaceae bacterium]